MVSKEEVHEKLESLMEQHLHTKDREGLAKFYDNWAPAEDKEAYIVGYLGPPKCAELMNEYFTDKNVLIFDCGFGSGLVGMEAMKYGFTRMDGNDISAGSLNVAKQKSIYEKLVVGDLAELRNEFPENGYDGVVCVGCFGPGHMTSTVFPEWIRIVKPGGYIINLIRAEHIDICEEHKDGKLDGAIKKLEREGKWKLVKRLQFPNYYSLMDGVAFVCQILMIQNRGRRSGGSQGVEYRN